MGRRSFLTAFNYSLDKASPISPHQKKNESESATLWLRVDEGPKSKPRLPSDSWWLLLGGVLGHLGFRV